MELNMNRPMHRGRFAAVLWLLALGIGCIHKPIKSPVAAFSTAASTAVSDSIAAFDSVELSYKQSETNALVLDYDSKGFHPETIQPFMRPEDREPRVVLLNALQRYAETLSAITAEKADTSFDEATTNLGNSLLSLSQNESFKKLMPQAVSEAEVKGVATAIDAVGRWLIERNVRRV